MPGIIGKESSDMSFDEKRQVVDSYEKLVAQLKLDIQNDKISSIEHLNEQMKKHIITSEPNKPYPPTFAELKEQAADFNIQTSFIHQDDDWDQLANRWRTVNKQFHRIEQQVAQIVQKNNADTHYAVSPIHAHKNDSILISPNLRSDYNIQKGLLNQALNNEKLKTNPIIEYAIKMQTAIIRNNPLSSHRIELLESLTNVVNNSAPGKVQNKDDTDKLKKFERERVTANTSSITAVMEYNAALNKLENTISTLPPDDPLSDYAKTIKEDIVKLREDFINSKGNVFSTFKTNIPLSSLTKGLEAVEIIVNPTTRKNSDILLPTLEQLDTFEKTVEWSKLKASLKNYGVAAAFICVAGTLLTNPITAPAAVTASVAIVAHCMGIIAIPGFAGIISGMSVSAVVGNAVIGVGQAFALPAANKNFAAWRYNSALKELNTEINLKLATGKSDDLAYATAAKNAMNEIQTIKLSDDKSIATYAFTSDLHLQSALKTILSALKNPDKADALQKNALFQETLDKKSAAYTAVSHFSLAVTALSMLSIPSLYGVGLLLNVVPIAGPTLAMPVLNLAHQLLGQAAVVAGITVQPTMGPLTSMTAGSLASQVAVGMVAEQATYPVKGQLKSHNPMADLRQSAARELLKATAGHLSEEKKNLPGVMKAFKETFNHEKTKYVEAEAKKITQPSLDSASDTINPLHTISPSHK